MRNHSHGHLEPKCPASGRLWPVLCSPYVFDLVDHGQELPEYYFELVTGELAIFAYAGKWINFAQCDIQLETTVSRDVNSEQRRTNVEAYATMGLV